MRHINKSEVLQLDQQVDYVDGQIASKTIAQNEHHSMTLFAFDKGEEISTHESGGDALVVALDGEATITIAGQEYQLNAGQSIVMPAQVPHAVYAKERFKMLLVVLFGE